MERPSFTRQQLYELVWKEPIQTLAPKFGLSDRGLAKLCERHAIPTPARGYWAKKQAGQKVAKIPLLELDGARVRDEIAIARFAPPERPPAPGADAPDPLLAFWRTQKEEIGAISVAKTLANPHRVIAAWLKEDERQREVQARWGGTSFMHSVRLTAVERRRLRVLSALYKALEERGVTIECQHGARIVRLQHGRDSASFDLREYVQQKRRPFNDEELARGWAQHSKYRVEQHATGLLRGKIETWLPKGVPTTWTETEERPFEDLLGEVAATVLTALAAAKARREEREADERRRWEAAEAARKREEAAKRERARKQLCASAPLRGDKRKTCGPTWALCVKRRRSGAWTFLTRTSSAGAPGPSPTRTSWIRSSPVTRLKRPNGNRRYCDRARELARLRS